MNFQEALAKAVATRAHQGQFRRDGVTPYITHPEAVAQRVSEGARPVAWLHDVIEDCAGYGVERLYLEGFSDEVVDAVSIITKSPIEDYANYINRVKSNPLTREVKIADIEHNLSHNPKPASVEKYKKALTVLKSETK